MPITPSTDLDAFVYMCVLMVRLDQARCVLMRLQQEIQDGVAPEALHQTLGGLQQIQHDVRADGAPAAAAVAQRAAIALLEALMVAIDATLTHAPTYAQVHADLDEDNRIFQIELTRFAQATGITV